MPAAQQLPPPPAARKRLALLSPQSDFVAEIVRSLSDATALLEPGPAKACMASPEAICDLVEIAYWASLQTEEGRSVRGTLCVVDPERVNTPIRLADPAPLTVATVVELLTASGGRDLGVHLTPKGVVVWGFTDVRSMFQASIRIVAPGAVVVTADDTAIGLIERGDAVAPISADMMELQSLTARGLGSHKPFMERLRQGAMFTTIARAMLSHGHGGTLVLVPPDTQAWESLVAVKHRIDKARGAGVIKERLNAYQNFAERLESHLTASSGHERGANSADLGMLLQASRDAHEKLFRDGLDWVGQLSAIDGAVVMTTEMELIGFGAKLHSNSPEPTVTALDMLDPKASRRRVALSALGGTRHQSAARFVNDCHDALVFVASQDGRLTLVAWVENPPQVAALANLHHFTYTKRL